MKNGYTYKLKKKMNIGDPLTYPIIRGNVEEEITLELLMNNYNMIKKTKRETEGKLKIAQGIKENIEEKHPEVLKMSKEELHLAAFYFNALNEVTAFTEHIKEYTTSMKAYRTGWGEITRQLDLNVELPKD